MNSISTKDLSLAEWRKLRENFIGGSDAVLGKSSYKTPYMVWLEKTQGISFFQGNAFSNFGTLFEPIVRQHFQEKMNLKVTEPDEMFIHPVYPMLSGNVDGLIHDEGNLGLGVLEIKCTTTHRISPHELSQNIPIEWYTQLMHYMGILDVEYGFLQVYYRDICEFAEPVYVERDDEIIRANNQRLSQWWKTFVEGNTPPPPSTTEDLLIKHPDSHESQIEASVHIRQRYNMLLSVRERIDGLKELKSSIEFDLKQYCGDHEAITVDKKPILTWKSSTRRGFDSKQFRKEYSELYARYQTETQTRTLRLKQNKL